MTKKEVQKKENTAPLAAFEADLEADAQEFEEQLTQADLAIPFLQVIQAQSPQVTEGDAQFIEGAVKGQLFNTVTKRAIYIGKILGISRVYIIH